MSSLTTSKAGRRPARGARLRTSDTSLPGARADEAVLYLATAAAIGASLLAAGWASGNAHVGALAAALALLGVWVSWLTRRWPARRRGALRALGAVLCAGALQALIFWEIRYEIGNLYMAQSDVGLSLALRMSVLLVALSFLLAQREALPFALVPGVTLFGLAGGRGAPAVAFACFLVFLPAALIALAQAMLLSGRQPTRREAEGREWTARPAPALPDPILTPSPRAERGKGGEVRPSPFASLVSPTPWRTRHWSLLGALLAAIIALGTLIYLPVHSYGNRYYWPLAMMTFTSARLGFLEQRGRDDTPRSYSVGQGPIAPDETPMLSFTGPPAPLWRGEVFDSFTGSAWRSTEQEPVRPSIVRGEVSPPGRAGPFPPTAPDALVTNEIRAEHDLPFVIYGAGQIRQAVLPLRLATAVQGRILADKFGCLTAPGVVLPAGARYQVTSDPALGTRDWGMGASNGRSLTPSPQPPAPSLDEAYLHLPPSSRRVADLARRLSANASSTQDKLQALVSYLDRECMYTRTAPGVPTGEDAADFFLFTSRRGYCDLFATAFAVMARAIGVPTRFVTGYAGGQYDPELGRYVLRQSDAHAWVEVWVERPVEGGASSVKRDAGGAASLHSSPSTLNGGWVAVDPTPGGGPVILSPFAQAVAAVRISFLSRPWARPLLGALLLAGAAAAVRLWRIRRRRAPGASRRLSARRPAGNEPRAIVLRAYARLTRALARRGLPRHPSQTPLEYLQSVGRAGRRLPARRRGRSAPALTLHAVGAIGRLTDLFLLARYSPHPIGPETAALALAALRAAVL
jgi:transglutaminase-like putative cysteine protease